MRSGRRRGSGLAPEVRVRTTFAAESRKCSVTGTGPVVVSLSGRSSRIIGMVLQAGSRETET